MKPCNVHITKERMIIKDNEGNFVKFYMPFEINDDFVEFDTTSEKKAHISLKYKNFKANLDLGTWQDNLFHFLSNVESIFLLEHLKNIAADACETAMSLLNCKEDCNYVSDVIKKFVNVIIQVMFLYTES